MKSLYETILDSDEKIVGRGKNALIYSLVNIVLECMPDIEITLTPDKSTVVGTTQTRNVVNILGRLKTELEKMFPHDVTSSRVALQIHINLPYEHDQIRCSFSFSRLSKGRTFVEGIRMNIRADKQKTLNVIMSIFKEIK